MSKRKSKHSRWTRLQTRIRSNLNILLPLFAIFASVFVLSTLFNLYHTNRHAQDHGKKAITQLEDYINQTANDLILLNELISPRCDNHDKLALRSHVFHSKMIKEIGIYRQSYVVCTSNEGPTSIRLYRSILDRIDQSGNDITISLTESISRMQTFFIYASKSRTEGINALLPPELFLHLVAPELTKQKYGYQIQILGKAIHSNKGVISSARQEFGFASTLYPMSVTIFLNAESYIHHFFETIWQTILMATLMSCLFLIVRQQTIQKNSIEFALRSAVENQQLKLHLQPIVDIETNVIVGSEALNRWHHPIRGHISPDIFIPLAEKIGLIEEMSKNSLKLITRMIYQNQLSLDQQYISLNISRQLIISPSFLDFMNSYSKKHHSIVPSLLLEITEDNEFAPQELARALMALRQLKHMGFKLAIDDFGTGYSGLDFIRQHRFNVMKIDKVFIKGLRADSSITPVLVSMIKLAEELDMTVIAEGVETQEQLCQLKALGVRYIQGFYYSQPMPSKEFIHFGLTQRKTQCC